MSQGPYIFMVLLNNYDLRSLLKAVLPLILICCQSSKSPNWFFFLIRKTLAHLHTSKDPLCSCSCYLWTIVFKKNLHNILMFRHYSKWLLFFQHTFGCQCNLHLYSRRKFACPQCDWVFKAHFNLHRHILTHMTPGQQQEECPECRTIITREQYQNKIYEKSVLWHKMDFSTVFWHSNNICEACMCIKAL